MMPGTRGASKLSAVAGALLLVGLTSCDDQVKYVPWFETMYRSDAVETYEEAAMLPPEGTVPLGAVRGVSLEESDALVNPLAGITDGEGLERGRILYMQFCVVCHGETGVGDGTVVGENRLPPLPTLNLLSQGSRARSDGYIWGMIANGRGVMPAYARIPAEDRWYVVNYVRQLQGGGPSATTSAGAAE